MYSPPYPPFQPARHVVGLLKQTPDLLGMNLELAGRYRCGMGQEVREQGAGAGLGHDG